MSAIDVARSLLAEGIRPLPVGFRMKKPTDPRTGADLSGWRKLLIEEATVDRYFNGAPQNVGALLGEPSGHLYDVDLDCREAIDLAPHFFAPTRTFGRASKEESHWLYRCASSGPTRQFKGNDKAMLVELRANGGQTVMPGSTHESGEPIEWTDRSVPIAVLDREDLGRRVQRLAAASLLRRCVPASQYVEAAHALAFSLIAGKWDAAEVRGFIDTVFGDITFDEGALTGSRGWDHLAELIGASGARVVGVIEAWLDVERPTAEQARDPKVDARDERSGGVPGEEVDALKAFDSDTRERRASAYARRLDLSVSGKGGHGKAIRAATSIACGFALTHDRAFDILSREWNTRCSPPWKPRELHHKIASALECMHVGWGSILLKEATEASNEAPPSIVTCGIDEILAPLPPVNWTIEYLRITCGAPTMWAGPSFVGKTVLAQHAGLCVATGGLFLGVHPVKRGLFVHVDNEQGRRVTFERYQRLARERGLSADELRETLRVALFPSVRLDSKDAADAYTRLAEGASLVVLDSMRALTPSLDENSSEIRAPLDMLSAVSDRTKAAFLIIDHTRKTTPNDIEADVSERLRGSGAKKDALQGLFMISGDKTGPKRVDHSKERVYGSPIESFGYEVHDVARDGDPRWGLSVVGTALDGTDGSQAATRTSRAHEKTIERIVMFLNVNGGSFAGSKDGLCKRVGINRNAFYAALSELESSGRVVVERDGKVTTIRVKGETP